MSRIWTLLGILPNGDAEYIGKPGDYAEIDRVKREHVDNPDSPYDSMLVNDATKSYRERKACRAAQNARWEATQKTPKAKKK